MRKYLFLSAMLIAGAVAGAWLITQAVAKTDAPPKSADLAQGEELYLGYCASCHGAKLEGQPDWRSPGPDGLLPAPPHDETGHTWHHPDSMLFDYTRLGGKAALAALDIDFASGMPGFGDRLTDDQIWSILAYIKSTWPDRQRQIQAERSAADAQTGKD